MLQRKLSYPSLCGPRIIERLEVTGAATSVLEELELSIARVVLSQFIADAGGKVYISILARLDNT